MTTTTDAWIAQHLGLTEEEYRQRLSRRARGEGVDLYDSLRTMQPVGPSAGRKTTIGRIPFTLVIALDHVRVWVGRDAWDRAFRSRSGPVFYELLRGGAWRRLSPGELSPEDSQQINQVILAARPATPGAAA